MNLSVTTRKYFSFVLLAGIVLFLLGVIFYLFESRHQEPQFQGKKLTDWAAEINQGVFFRLPAFQQHQEQSERAIAVIHPYRFVWIDACDTGAGRFCESFGIPAFTVSTNFFAAAGVESRAFIGYTKPINFDPSNSSSDPNGWPNRSSMMHNFLDAWLSGQVDLNTIITTAKAGTFGYGTPLYIPNQDKWIHPWLFMERMI